MPSPRKLTGLGALSLLGAVNGFNANVTAAECLFPFPREDRSEQVWPYLANIDVIGVFDEPATLRAGQYQGAPFVAGSQSRPELRLWPELLISADLDGNPGDEKIGLLSETSGGSGERLYLLVAIGARRFSCASGRVVGRSR